MRDGPLGVLAHPVLMLWSPWCLLLSRPRILPGVYDVTSNGQLAISVMDMHMHDEEQGSWITLGLVVENEQNSDNFC